MVVKIKWLFIRLKYNFNQVIFNQFWGPNKRLKNVKYQENPKIENFVFICGLHRSGTTLLERLITENFNVSYLRANNPQSEGQYLQSLLPNNASFLSVRFAFSKKMEEKYISISNINSDECFLKITSDWNKFIVGSSTTLVEKSPPNLICIWLLRKIFKKSKFIIISRHPKAQSAAVQKWTKSSLADLMMHWNVAYSKAIKDFRKEDCLFVRYEELCADFKKELERISTFLQIPLINTKTPNEERFSIIENTNSKYMSFHECSSYGVGAWDKFGYEV